MMHTIEYDGGRRPGRPWKVTTDDGYEWHASIEADAALELAAFIIGRMSGRWISFLSSPWH